MPGLQRIVLGLGALLLCFATEVQAQDGGLSVQVVNGSTGDPVVGARVSLAQEASFIRPTTLDTDRRGRADFPVLIAVSGYRLLVEADGFTPRAVPAIRVTADVTRQIVVELLEVLEERVTVSAETWIRSAARRCSATSSSPTSR